MVGPHFSNLVLVGYRGCGKSTVGRLLAQRLGYAYCDTDELIEQRLGRSIAEIFEQDGEAFFRSVESNVIVELSHPARLFHQVSSRGSDVVGPARRATEARGGDPGAPGSSSPASGAGTEHNEVRPRRTSTCEPQQEAGEIRGLKSKVISLGGGAIENEPNRKRIARLGVVVWLTAPAEELNRRLCAKPAAPLRPSLTGMSLIDEIRHMLRVRGALYESVADGCVDTTERTPEEVAEMIQARLVASGQWGPAVDA